MAKLFVKKIREFKEENVEADASFYNLLNNDFTNTNDTVLVTIIKMNAGENRLSPSILKQLSAALDFAIQNSEKYEDYKALLITIGIGKFFCNGVDLKWVLGQEKQEIKQFEDDLDKLLHRLTYFPIPTVAALNGHSYGGGLTFALSFDYRSMSPSNGWLRIPAVNLGIIIPPSFINLISYKLNNHVMRDLVLEGKKYNAEEAYENHLIDFVVERDRDLLEETIKWSLPKGKKLSNLTYQKLKHALYPEVSTSTSSQFLVSFQSDQQNNDNTRNLKSKL